MKISTLIRPISVIFVLILFFSLRSYSQSIIKPAIAFWVADNKSITLNSAIEKGIKRPKKLTLSIIFRRTFAKKYHNKNLDLEFKWYKFYSTGKELMETYVKKYSEDFEIHEKNVSVSSTVKNITAGTYEVVVISKHDNKKVSVEKGKRFILKIR